MAFEAITASPLVDPFGHFNSLSATLNFVLTLVRKGEDTEIRFRTKLGMDTGNNSQRTAKWSYLDQPVKAMPRKLIGLPWHVVEILSRFITLSHEIWLW